MRRERVFLLIAWLIAGLMIFARLGDLPLRDPDEGRNTQVAKEMREAGAWLTPTLNGLVYLDKPAFFFKAVAISMAFFGDSETAARLPSAFFALGVLGMVYGFCRREYDQTTASLAVIIVATTPSFFALARHVIFDMTLGFFVCGAIFAGYFAEADPQKRRLWYLLGSASAGLATLVKGPVGFLVPILALTVFNLTDKNPGWWKRLFHPLNFLVFFAVTLPWFIGLSILHPDFPHYGLVEESFNRFTTGSFRRKAPFYYYGLVILGGLFAWSALLPEAARVAWQKRARWTRADRFLIFWALAVTIFFSISKSKLPHYILSALVALGILTARLFATALKNRENVANRVVFRGLTALAILCIGFAIFLSLELVFPDAYRRVLKINSSEFSRVSVVFGPGACLLALVAATAFVGRWKKDARIAFASFMIIPLAFVSIGFPAIMRYSEASSSRALASMIPKDIPVVCLQSFPVGLPFYIGKQVTLISTDGGELTSNYVKYSLKKSERWPAQVVPFSEHEEWLKSRKSAVYIVSNKNAKPNLEIIAAKHHSTIQELTNNWWGLALPAQSANLHP